MKVYFYEDGKFEKATGDSIFKQSDNANIIELKLPMAKNNSVVFTTLLLPFPKGEQYGQYAAQSLLMELVVDEEEGGFKWVGKLADGYLKNNGIAYLSARVQTNDGTITKTTEQVKFLIQNSGDYTATAVLPELSEQILNKLAQAEADISSLRLLKQDKTDETLNTIDKTVVGAINEVNDNAKATATSLEQEKVKIAKNTEDIEKIKQSTFEGIDRIGKYPTQAEFPTDEQLNQFVLDEAKRPAKNGDYVTYTDLDGNNYEIYFAGGKWQEPDLQAPIEKAENNVFGVVRGTPDGEETQRLFKVDIQQGDIKQIYIIRNDQRIELGEYINSLYKTTNDMIIGQQVVGESVKATNDGLGRNIATTYAENEKVYDKDYMDNNFLRDTYTNIFYYTKNGIVDNIPTDPNQTQFIIQTTDIGDFVIFNISRTVIAKYNFNKNTTDQSAIWVQADRDCVAEFRLTTTANKNGVEKLLNTELTGELRLTANTPKLIKITSIYNALGNEEYTLEKGGELFKKLEVTIAESTPTVFSVLCGEQNASTFNLVAQSISFNVNTINGKKKVEIKANEWVDNGDGTFTATITPSRHEQAPSDEYGLDLQYQKTADTVQRLGFTPEIKTDGTIIITAYEARDCQLLIWTSIEEAKRQTLQLTNPTVLPLIDYDQYGAMNIKQTNEPVELTLPIPTNPAPFYNFSVANDNSSTKEVKINGLTIEINHSIGFKWHGNNWQLDDTPDKTSEITDNLNNQPLNDTLKEIPKKANKDGSNIQVEVWQNILGLNEKSNNKSVELKSGLAVDNLIDFFKYFYDLRKGLNDTWEIEVGNGKNENIMQIFGFPYGENPTNSAELIIKRKATSGIGYTLELTFASEKSNTTHTGYVRGWILSGTAYDKYIHFTGWRNARGGQWVDEVNGDITLTDTDEIILNIGEFKNPYNNFLIAEITKNGHSYNSFLMLSITAPNVGETTIKLDNEDVYVELDYNAKTFKISKTSSGQETLKVHLYEKLI